MRIVKALDLIPESVDLLGTVGLDLVEGRAVVDALAAEENRDKQLSGLEVVDVLALPRRHRVEDGEVGRVVDRLVVREGMRQRLTDSVETALRLSDGLVVSVR